MSVLFRIFRYVMYLKSNKFHVFLHSVIICSHLCRSLHSVCRKIHFHFDPSLFPILLSKDLACLKVENTEHCSLCDCLNANLHTLKSLSHQLSHPNKEKKFRIYKILTLGYRWTLRGNTRNWHQNTYVFLSGAFDFLK